MTTRLLSITHYDSEHNLRTELQGPLDAAERDCRELAKIAKQVKLGYLYKKLGLSWSQFCKEWTGHSPSFVEAVIRGVEAIGERFPIPIQEAHQAGLRTHREAGAMGGRGKKASVTNTSFPRGATRVDYIKARLKRDGQTDLLARVDSEEISAHAAAVEMGWRKRMVQCEPTVDGFSKAAKKHLSASQIEDLIMELSK